jgi:hypothetical protein
MNLGLTNPAAGFFSFVLEQRLNREEDSITGARFALDCEPGSRCT